VQQWPVIGEEVGDSARGVADVLGRAGKWVGNGS